LKKILIRKCFFIKDIEGFVTIFNTFSTLQGCPEIDSRAVGSIPLPTVFTLFHLLLYGDVARLRAAGLVVQPGKNGFPEQPLRK